MTEKHLRTEKGETRIIKDKTLISIGEKEGNLIYCVLVTKRDENRMIN